MAESLESAQARASAKIHKPTPQQLGQPGTLPKLGQPKPINLTFVATVAVVGLIAVLWLWMRNQPRAANPITHVAPSTPPVKAIPSFPGSAVPNPNGLILNGIVFGSGEPYTLINGKILKISESIQGYTVQEISQNAVMLTDKHGNALRLSVND
jgi:hypothetical protein